MGMLDFFRREQRMVTELPGIERPGANLLQIVGIGDVALPTVTIDIALRVPSVWAAVSFLSRTLAALPLHAYRKEGERIAGGLETLVHEAPNPEWTSFKLRQHFWQQVFTGGRGLLYIERAGANITGLFTLDPSKVRIKRDPLGNTTYDIGGKSYSASDIIDVPFMLKADGLNHYGPISTCQKAIQLALAMNDYGSSFFAGGGVPPLALVGPLASGPEARARATDQIGQAISEAQKSNKPIVNLPPGYELKPIGFDPDKGQMTDARRFQVEEIARAFNLPPVFLQDLTHGSYSNTEQQSLQLVKFSVSQWIEAFEQELNLKLFGQRNGNRYVEHSLEGLLRGDFVTRMNGLAQAIQNGVLTPNEARALENRPPLPHGDDLMIQGATVPLGTQSKGADAPPPQGNDNGA